MIMSVQPVANSNSQESPVRLRPLIAENIQNFLKKGDLVHQLTTGFGSPLNIIFPDNIEANLKSFKEAYKKHFLKGRIYFTSKPCKSKALVRKASLYDVGVDVSSSASLDHVLSAGFSPDRIEATGPKNIDYILKCLQLDILLNVDSISELHRIVMLKRKVGLSRKARVMVRLAGFSTPRMHFTPQDGTFGTHLSDIPAVIEWLIQNKDEVDFKGFSFHVNDANQQQKLVAIENALQLTFEAIKKGLKPAGIDIGGGFSIQYAKSAEEYSDYQEYLKKSVLGKVESQVWNNGGLGYKEHNGVVVGGPLFMNHVPAHTKGNELDYILSQKSAAFGNVTYADVIRDSLLELYIEPGRAMLDQCGITLSRVAFVKESTWGETLVGLEMNRSNIHSLNIKNLCEPFIIPRNPQKNRGNDKGMYFVGNLCLAYDMIQYNKVYPDILPEVGDIVAFINTAPYMMDFTESETLMHPVAKKVAVWYENGNFKWAADEKFIPINGYDGEVNDY
jgi:diaminopimelate decarboxylase